MKTQATEQAPALPTALLEDLTRSVAIQSNTSHQRSFAGLFESLRAMMASPAFGGAAAAVMVLAIASAVILRPDAPSPSDGFRGSGAYSATDSARVILIGASAELRHDLEADLEDGVLTSAASIEGSREIKGARVILDLNAQTITGINARGETLFSRGLPESSSSISLEIAFALSELR